MTLRNLLGLKILRIAIFCLTPFICGIAFAQGARLFTYSNPPKAQALGAKENARLSQIRSLKSTASVTFIQLDAAALNNNILQIPLPNGKSFALINSLRESDFPGIISWVGRSSDGAAYGSFTLNQKTGFASGHLSFENQVYSIDSYGPNAQVLVLLDQSQLPPEHEPRTEKAVPPKAPTPPKIGAQASGSVQTLAVNSNPIVTASNCQSSLP